MATIVIPSLMRDLTGGQAKVNVPGRTVAQVIDALDALYPGAKARLCNGDERLENGARLDHTIAVVVDGKVVRLGLRAPVKAESEIRFMPAIEGG